MTPVNTQYSVGYTLSETITWTGEDIPCLGICHGQLLNSVVYNIAIKLCTALAPYDLSTLTLECIFDILNEDEIGDRTLVSVLQTLADSNCTLKELLDALTAKVDGISTPILVLDLKCFKTFDSFGNVLPYDEQSILQILINEACDNKSTVAGIGGKLIDLQTQINEVEASIPDVSEPIISTCISSNKPVSQSIIDLSSNYCEYKGDVGDSFKIQQNISKINDAINLIYVGVSGWTVTPNNMADYIGNLSIILNDQNNRISNIENSCCSISCKDLTLGFEITPASSDSVYLRFTELAGTAIPISFIDKGSTLQISDSLGATVSFNLAITENKLLGEFSYSGLNINSPLTFSVTGIMGNDSLTCEKCISRQYSPDAGCPVCMLTASGTSGTVTLIYEISNV